MHYYLANTFIDSLVESVNYGIDWAIKVSIFATAGLLAISIISWLIHRS